MERYPSTLSTLTTIVVGIGVLLHGTHASAVNLTDWQASEALPSGNFTDVAFVGDERVFSGFTFNSFTGLLEAAIFTTSGVPGTELVSTRKLGFAVYPSVTTAVEWDRAGGYYFTAVQARPNDQFVSFIYHSSDFNGWVQVFGPPPTNSNDVCLNSINPDGLAVGDEAAVYPLISDAAGNSTRFIHADVAQLLGVDSTGLLFGGYSEPPTLLGAPAATIWDAQQNVLMKEAVEGIVWDLEGSYAVGMREGFAAYWRKVGPNFESELVRNAGGAPLAGELLTIDHNELPIAGGRLEDGRAIVVDLASGEWFDVESRVSVPPGTFSSVVGINSLNGQLALAVNGTLPTGWDVTANVRTVPGPGWIVAPFLLVIGARSNRGRR